MAKVRQAIRCKAKKTNGQPCKAWAMKGQEVCKTHGGMAPQNRRKAKERVALEKITRWHKLNLRGEDDDRDPIEHLLDELRWSSSVVSILGEEVSKLDELHHTDHLPGDGTRTEIAPLVRLWNEERDRHARLAKMCVDAGIQERQITLAEKQANLLATAIRGILLDLGVGHDPRVPQIVRKHLTAVSASTWRDGAIPAEIVSEERN